MGGAEYGIDAPWRLEPPYQAIPITVTVHDASEQKDPATAVPFTRFCGLSVAEQTPTGNDDFIHRFTPAQFFEFERHAKWPADSDGPMFSELTRVWADDPIEPALNIQGSAEWSAVVMFTPVYQRFAGDTLRLTAAAHYSQTNVCPGLPTPLEDISNNTSGVDIANSSLINGHLSIEYGNTLPRFGSNWVYGDVHVHAQGTDNEGEVGIPYRPVLQTMKAMGLDFAFATDHASDSTQVTDLDPLFVDSLPDTFLPDFIEDWILDKVDNFSFPTEASRDQRRDVSQLRFNFLRAWLNDANGANDEVVASQGARIPQLFLGGEVDVIPEISAQERSDGFFRYGFMKSYNWRRACFEVPSEFIAVMDLTTFEICGQGIPGLTEEAQEGGRFKLRDVQGIGSNDYARQHILHLPADPTRDSAFISGSTETYGGATIRLKKLVEDDYAMQQKGFFFLAHPVSAAGGSGYGRLGPDLVPFSDVQLRTAFDSPQFLGLQLWNENTRVKSKLGTGYPHLTTGGDIYGWEEHAQDGQLSALHHGAAVWDKMLLWGLEQWTATGTPRRVFMAGGSDAHGDFNYRRNGYVVGWTDTNDTALGSPRNLVDVGAARPEGAFANNRGGNTIGQQQVIDGLRSGEFVVSDGPIVRIAVDTNGNGIIDDQDVPMGGTSNFDCDTLLVEWQSTPEFGRIHTIDFYVGVRRVGYNSLVYAPRNHGPRGNQDFSGNPKSTRTAADGTEFTELFDRYMLDPTERLRIEIPASRGFGGTEVVRLEPQKFELFQEGCTSEEVCETIPGTGTFCYDVETCEITNHGAPQKLVVRAIAQSETSRPIRNGASVSVPRLGYTNPIWLDVFGDVCEACPSFDPSDPDPAFCTPECPCEAMTGDCDPNAGQCAEGLVCHDNNGALAGLPSHYDLCVSSCPAFDATNPNGSHCSLGCPCGFGEGDCDPGQCRSGLVCGVNNGPQFGLPSGWEVCINSGPPCGNGQLDRFEVCDDGNRNGGDGCNASCQVESGWQCPQFNICFELPRCNSWHCWDDL